MNEIYKIYTFENMKKKHLQIIFIISIIVN